MRKLLILIIAVLAFAACSQNNKAPGEGKTTVVAAPAEEPTGANRPDTQPVAQTPSPVATEDVLAVYKGIVIELTNKATGEVYRAEVPFDEATLVEGTAVTVKVLQFLPDFVMSEAGYATRSLEPKNVAARVLITGTAPDYDGVLFMQYPDVHPYEGEEYAVQLVNVITK